MRLDRSTTNLLRGLLLPGEIASKHLDEWCRQTDLDGVDSATHQLLPLVYRRLTNFGMAPPEIDRLRGVYRKTWYRNQRHLEAVRQAAEVLANADVELTLIRGLALALGAYGEIGLRMVDAAQVVVPPGAMSLSIELLTRAGFAVDGSVGLPGFGIATRLIHGGGGRVDVHEFVYGPGWSKPPDQPLWERRQTLELDGPPIATLAPSDAVAAATAFGLSMPVSRYRCLVDTALLARQTDPEVVWTDVVDSYRDTLLSVPIAEALGVIGDQLPGALTPEAQDTVRQLQPTLRRRADFWSHRRGRRLVRLPAWYRRATGAGADTWRVGFVRFTKAVYGVDTTRDLVAKALQKIRPG